MRSLKKVEGKGLKGLDRIDKELGFTKKYLLCQNIYHWLMRRGGRGEAILSHFKGTVRVISSFKGTVRVISSFKGTVSVISSDPHCRDGNVRLMFKTDLCIISAEKRIRIIRIKHNYKPRKQQNLPNY